MLIAHSKQFAPPKHMLVSRTYRCENTVIDVSGIQIGGDKVVVMAGPCSVESRQQIIDIAQEVKRSKASILRGGAFKPRTSPYSFRGLGKQGLHLLVEARAATGLPIVTEVLSPSHVPLIAQYADIPQVGARSMQNYPLLCAVGSASKPVLLKRGMGNTLEELLYAAEYILSTGNEQVILCERGIRTFESATRYTLDINAIPVLKEMTHLPVIVDPSHATGKASFVAPVARSAIAAGADGLLVEVHPNPEMALSDGEQSLTPQVFATMMTEVEHIARVLHRSL
jgi:3-deoxy-7-phosphoheptulonate synthase